MKMIEEKLRELLQDEKNLSSVQELVGICRGIENCEVMEFDYLEKAELSDGTVTGGYVYSAVMELNRKYLLRVKGTYFPAFGERAESFRIRDVLFLGADI